MDRKVYAWIDVTPEILGGFVALLPPTIKIIGSLETDPLDQVIRLAIDVTLTGVDVCGPWLCTITIAGGSKTAAFAPHPHRRADL